MEENNETKEIEEEGLKLQLLFYVSYAMHCITEVCCICDSCQTPIFFVLQNGGGQCLPQFSSVERGGLQGVAHVGEFQRKERLVAAQQVEKDFVALPDVEVRNALFFHPFQHTIVAGLGLARPSGAGE